jgi:hypothetical protein
MFLLGAFLTGGVVGFAAGRTAQPSRTSRSFDERAMRDEFAQQLNLSADQRRVIDSVFDWRRARSREIMLQYRPALDSVRDSARVLMRAVLDSTQRTKFAELIESSKRAADSSRRAREGGR